MHCALAADISGVLIFVSCVRYCALAADISEVQASCMLSGLNAAIVSLLLASLCFFPLRSVFSAPHRSGFLFPRSTFPAQRPSFPPPHSAIPPSECTTHCPVFPTSQFDFFTIGGRSFGVFEPHHRLCQWVLSGSIFYSLFWPVPPAPLAHARTQTSRSGREKQ